MDKYIAGLKSRQKLPCPLAQMQITARKDIIRAWWSARFVGSHEYKLDLTEQIGDPAKNYRLALKRLQRSIAEFKSFDSTHPASPLQMMAARGEKQSAVLLSGLDQALETTSHAAIDLLSKLSRLEESKLPKGRPLSITTLFAQRLSKSWFQLTGKQPTVTHRPITGERSGEFLAYLAAAVATLQRPEIDHNLESAAESAARWFRETQPSDHKM